jgi:hypothetical protein
MKTSEVKLRLINFANGLIDTYFSNTSLTDKMINSTLKIIVKQNSYRADSILKLFTDANGEIDLKEIVYQYAETIGDNGITIDIRDYIDNDFIKQYLPNKALLVKKDDIMSLLL